MTPQRIQRRRTKGSRMPEGAVYVGRPTRWGNPFAVGAVIERFRLNQGIVEVRVKSRAHAVDCYRAWLDGTPLLVGGHDLAPLPHTVAEIQAALAGHDLACWCPLDQPCHADVLLEIANKETH